MMLDAKTSDTVREMVERMKRPLLLTHVKPDGDALGSLAAMQSILRGQDVHPVALLFDAIPGRYALFQRLGSWTMHRADAPFDGLTEVDGVIILDTCTYNQLEPIAEWLKSVSIPKIAVDHHLTRDNLADAYLVDESAAATCLILYEWTKSNRRPPSPAARDALFIGIAMDTGWFIHSNTDARALMAAGELVSQGVTAHELHRRLYHRESPARIRLLGEALSSMELLADDRLSVMTLSSGAIRRAGATVADTEDIINEPMRIAGVIVSILLVEHGDGIIRVSFRSKEPLIGATGTEHGIVIPEIDVAAIAQEFGGGGHARAAGAKIRGSLGDVRKRVIERLSDMLSR